MISYGAEGITTPRIPFQDNDYLIAFAVWKPPVFTFAQRKCKRQTKNETKKKPSNDRRLRRRKCMGFYGAMGNRNDLFTFPFFPSRSTRDWERGGQELLIRIPIGLRKSAGKSTDHLF